MAAKPTQAKYGTKSSAAALEVLPKATVVAPMASQSSRISTRAAPGRRRAKNS